METIHDILKINYSLTSLKQSAQKFIPISLASLIELRIEKMNKIVETLGESDYNFTGNYLIPDVFKKFKTSLIENNIQFDLKELRTLTYSLTYDDLNKSSIFNNEIELGYALNLLESNWKDSFLIGLMDCYLKTWGTTHRNSLELLAKFINQKFKTYYGRRKSLITFKKNKQYYSLKNGDIILGDTIAKLNRQLHEAPIILGLNKSWFQYSYFSKVIVTYYERNKNRITEIIDNLDKVLTTHQNEVTKKRLISKIIIQANNLPNAHLKEKIKSMAVTHIGDPENNSYWSIFDNATNLEKNEIMEARNILKGWITQQFINVFFNVCINDDRRRRFWLKFASQIDSFKVYGPKHTKYALEKDKSIEKIIPYRFEDVRSKKDVSAFILYIGNYMLIEFSNEGYAFYAYKLNSPNRPNLNPPLISVDELRNSAMPMAVQTDSYNNEIINEEGRLRHQDGNQIWEIKFINWMNKMVFK